MGAPARVLSSRVPLGLGQHKASFAKRAECDSSLARFLFGNYLEIRIGKTPHRRLHAGVYTRLRGPRRLVQYLFSSLNGRLPPCLSKKNHSAIHHSVKMILLSMILPSLPPLLSETPPQQALRLAQGLLCVPWFTHFAGRDFALKILFPPFLFEHFSDIRI